MEYAKFARRATVVACVLASAPVAGLAAGPECAEAERLFQASIRMAPAEREAALARIVALCPGHAQALNNLGLARENQGRLAEAEDFYRRAAAADPTFPEPHAGLGDVLRARGDRDGAARAYRDFLNLAAGARHLAPHLPDYRARLRELDPDGEKLVGSGSIVAALTTMPTRTRGVSIVGRDLDRPHIDIAIPFDFNSDSLRDDSLRQIAEVARALASPALEGARIRIEGHTDAVGAEDYNRDLSRRRAESVARALVERFGVDSRRLIAAGLGESAPVDSNDTERGRARNRRVTFVNTGS